MPGNGHRVDTQLGEVHRHLPDRLDGIGVHGDRVRPRQRRDLLDRLQRADLVVGHHQRDERHGLRVGLDRPSDVLGPDPAKVVDRQPLHLGTLVLREPDGRIQYCVVLDPAQQDPAAARILGQPGPPQALQGEVVRLSTA